jgi:hypothetical protein
VVVVWWDVYHSGMQTFGLCRIYESKRGNDPSVGRRLDLLLNQVLYAGPLLGGVVLFDHVVHFQAFEGLGWMFFAQIPYFAIGYASVVTQAILAVAVAVIVYYLYAQVQLWRSGHLVSWQKVALLVSTAVCSLAAWGFNAFGTAFMIMTLFHAVQYYALIWVVERHNLAVRGGLGGFSWGPAAAYGGVVSLCLVCAFVVHARGTHGWLIQLGVVVSLMHYWYDGFIWSVQRKMV